jgi:hypothetical protein
VISTINLSLMLEVFALLCVLGSVELWELSVEKDSLGCVGRTLAHDSIVSTVTVNSDSSKFVSADHGGW